MPHPGPSPLDGSPDAADGSVSAATVEAALVASMGDGLYAVDLDRRITFWNPAAEAITGYERDAAVGRWCGDGLLNHVAEDGTPLCGSRCPLLATMADGLPRTARVYLHHQEGHVTPVRITAAPIRDADGRITGAVETFADDSSGVALDRRLEEAERLALIDPLTGLGNRRHLDLALERRFSDWTRRGRPFAVIAVDVDHFKAINDAHGHDTGDRVLTVVARSLAAAVRAEDEVFRPGGDEFVVLTGPITIMEMAALAARLRMVVSAGRYGLDRRIRVTVSMGCALVRDDDDASSVSWRADVRLLTAKRAGRDAVVSESAPESAPKSAPESASESAPESASESSA
jgi:diguanylate cyclase (GGDEF)-like protein/PAS domain S-box-containing protein